MNSSEILLKEAIDKQEITKVSKHVLMEIAKDKHGINEKTPAELLSGVLNHKYTLDQITTSIIELQGKNLLVTDNYLLHANYKALDIDDKFVGELTSLKQAFTDLSQPHSTKSMLSLDNLFDSSNSVIYIALEITSPKIFKKLEERAKSNKKTVFLLPRKQDIEDSKHEHYNEVLQQWKNFFKQQPSFIKNNVYLRITNEPYKELYTSALTENKARYDLFFLDSNTTRHGNMFEIKENTSLYLLILQRYKSALSNSYPYFRLWPREFVKELCLKNIFFILLLFAGLGVLHYDINNGAIGIIFAIIANIITDKIKVFNKYNGVSPFKK